MKKRQVLTIALIASLAIFGLGCKKSTMTNDGRNSKAEVSFAFTASPVSMSQDQTKAAAVAEPLPTATELRIVVYKQNETTNPVAEGQFVIGAVAGKAAPKTNADKIFLEQGTYDFYYFVPNSTPVDSKIAIAAGDVALASGKKTTLVEADDAGKCLLSVDLKRLNAMMDVVLYYAAESGVKTMAQNGKITVSRMPATAKMNPVDATIEVDQVFSEVVELETSQFTAVTDVEGAGTEGFTTYANDIHKGAIVLPTLVKNSVVTVPLVINGVNKTVIAKLADMNLEAGKYYTLKLKVSLSDEIEASIVEFVYKSSSESMGEKGQVVYPVDKAANCYIICPGQEIEFNATAKPRSVNGLGHQGYANNTSKMPYTGGIYKNLSGAASPLNNQQLTTDLKPEYIDKIEVVWQTLVDHGSAMLVSGKDVENYKTYDFTSPSSKSKLFIKSITYDNTTGTCKVSANGIGNALIAAYDDGGAILWSWHIWGTDQTPNTIFAVGAEGDAGKRFMDRDLGALSTTKVRPTVAMAYKYFGLLYQAGRKEPFTGQGPTYDLADPTLKSCTPTAIFDKNGKWIQSTVPDETAYTEPSGDNLSSGKQTNGGYNVLLDGKITVMDHIQQPLTFMISNAAGATFDAAYPWTVFGDPKSIYDPCPYGYRVPGLNTLTRWVGSIPARQWTNRDLSGGMVLHDSWWPVGGYRRTEFQLSSKPGRLEDVGSTASYWVAELKPDWIDAMTKVDCLFFVNNYQGYGQVYDFGLYSSYGYAVRCIQE